MPREDVVDVPALPALVDELFQRPADEGVTLALVIRQRDEIIAELENTKIAERSGRAMDHEAEDAFERLRVDGYM